MHTTQHAVAFRDINAQAPTHVLVVPREHYANAAELAAGDPEASVELVTAAAAVAQAEGYDDYRMVFNTGPSSGQTVEMSSWSTKGTRTSRPCAIDIASRSRSNWDCR